ncbi:unnamed protein product [Euphydryas editha]|uniref:Uncharacterized protein n=1 Tax=Euphydryas editha TaxID=104508 RepID=A0AAU9UK75_EUPED|nr:unnamed protein product [Euphydryas editha]
MWSTFFVAVLFIFKLADVNSQDDEFYFDITTTTETPMKEEEVKMSEYILKVIEHYKQPDPEGWPGAKLPDPFLIPDSNQFLAFGTNLDFKNTTLHGVNKFRIVYINTDIGKVECRAVFVMDNLQIHGKYSLNTWLSSYPGGFSSNISGIRSEVIASLGVEQDGQLRAQDISIDITFENITMQFENAGFMATMLQGIFNSMGSILYDSIKSYLLEDAETNMRNFINNKLDQVVGNIEFSNTISIIDMVLVDVRKKIKDIKMDPLNIEDYVSTIGIFKLTLNNTVLKGLSTFYRIGNVKFRLENQTLLSDFEIGTRELQGSTCWEISGINGFINNTGSLSFSVAYIQGRFLLAQPMDTRQKTEFRDLQLEVGNIQFGSDGAGTLDYIIEVSGNILPTFLRYQIISAIEYPLRWKIQQELDHINIEEVIINALPAIDEMQENGFQLAELRMLNTTDEINFDDDEFFNF